MSEQEKKEKQVEVDGKQMSQNQFEEKKQEMPNSQRLTEVGPDKFRTIKRMQE